MAFHRHPDRMRIDAHGLEVWSYPAPAFHPPFQGEGRGGDGVPYRAITSEIHARSVLASATDSLVRSPLRPLRRQCLSRDLYL